MKLLKQTRGIWRYQLNRHEAKVLTDLLKIFPFTHEVPAKISKTSLDSNTAERENLLREFLQEHRTELRKRAEQLLARGKIEEFGEGSMLKLTAEEREFLLQILNDIRLGAWHALGQPEDLEAVASKYLGRKLVLHRLINLAGYFEHHLISAE